MKYENLLGGNTYMKANNRKWFGEKGLWLATFIPLLLTLIILPFLQESLPAHYDMDGNVDRWGSKYEQLILPIIIIFLSLFWKLFINYYQKKELSGKTDKDRQEASSNKKVIYLVAIGMAVMFTFMHIAFIYSAVMTAMDNRHTSHLDINVISNVSLGVFIMVLGNYLPKTKRNSFVGVRTSNSMKDDNSWSKENRFGGKIFLLTGILIIIQALLFGGMISTFITIALLLLTGIIITIHSYS